MSQNHYFSIRHTAAIHPFSPIHPSPHRPSLKLIYGFSSRFISFCLLSLVSLLWHTLLLFISFSLLFYLIPLCPCHCCCCFSLPGCGAQNGGGRVGCGWDESIAAQGEQRVKYLGVKQNWLYLVRERKRAKTDARWNRILHRGGNQPDTDWR